MQPSVLQTVLMLFLQVGYVQSALNWRPPVLSDLYLVVFGVASEYKFYCKAKTMQNFVGRMQNFVGGMQNFVGRMLSVRNSMHPNNMTSSG